MRLGLGFFLLLSTCGNVQAQPLPGADYVAGDLIRFTGDAETPTGAWCWFQDERVIVDDRHPDGPILMFTSISASGDNPDEQGDLDFHSYGLASGDGGTVELHDRLGQDDHNVAALWQRPDGRTVALYARHSKDNVTYARVSEPNDPSRWGDAKIHESEARVTYNNLLTTGTGATRKLLNFSRINGWDPNFLVSDDLGLNWRYGGRLLDDAGRPYLKYANSRDGSRVHVVATDQHPRDFDNSIYHGVTDSTAFYNSFGKQLDADISDQKAVSPKAMSVVFAGNADNVAWMADVAVDKHDNPVIAFSVQKDGRGLSSGSGGLDHRYYLARFDGNEWRHSEIAYAGERLYPREDDSTGLIAIDPEDVDRVVISTNADPLTGAPLVSDADGRRHYEIFAGQSQDGGLTFTWTPVTANSTVDNIRPVIPAWKSEQRALLWMRGTYRTYTDFETQIVGLLELR